MYGGIGMTEEAKSILIERMYNNLRILRTKLNLSQEDLAQKLGISRYSVIQIENGQRKMTWNTFLALVLIFIKNPETDELLSFYDIYTEELNNMLKLK